MENTRIKYAHNNNAEYVEYVGLGTHISDNQDGISIYYPSENSQDQWDLFFKNTPESILFYVFLDFWWNLKENSIEPEDLPNEYADNLKYNIEKIENILKKYLVFNELPPPYFKYLDFIEGNKSFLEIIDEEEIENGNIVLTLASNERIIINQNEELKQLFIPLEIYEEFKSDLNRLISLIVHA